MQRALLLILLLSFSVSPGFAGLGTEPEAVLKRIEQCPPHPRLFWGGGGGAGIRDRIAGSGRLKDVWEAVVLIADNDVREPPVSYEKEGRRLLAKSREALGRLTHLGLAFRITREQKYAQRAFAEMQAMADMPDWNPSHFLDTAEMTLAMAIGYDWFYDQLPGGLKITARRAIENKGLRPYLEADSPHGWEKGGNNWNQVCHAGMLGGALALAEEDPVRAREVVMRALAGLPYGMKVYDPDGNYPEGPGYWGYGTTMNVVAISLLESALGTDFGLSGLPGFLQTGEFPLHTMGPARLPFNFSDCGTGAGFNPAVVWFANRAMRPEIMWFEWELLSDELRRIRESKGSHTSARLFPLVLFWAGKGDERKQPTATSWMARGQNPLAVFRSSWTDSNALFLAIKGGTPGANHGHMDIGSFVLDALGERWSLDLGAQDYNRLEQRGVNIWDRSQDSERWTVFRYSNAGHSTLVVSGGTQRVSSQSPILDFIPGLHPGGAAVDMSGAYSTHLSRAVRRFAFYPGRVEIEDNLVGGASVATVRWGMVTRAKLNREGATDWLTQNGKKMRIQVVSPKGAVLTTRPVDRPVRDYDEPNRGVSVVGFDVEVEPGEQAKLKVVLEPDSTE